MPGVFAPTIVGNGLMLAYGSGLIVTCVDVAALQPEEFVTVRPRVTEPDTPAA